MSLLLAAVLGIVIGLSLGALGGGGSILTVPALVYVLDQSPRAATTGSLVIVGITALAGAFGHARSGNVRWAAGMVFGLVGVGASFLGTALNRRIDPNLLLLAFAVLMFVVAAAMLRRSLHHAPEREPDPAPDEGSTSGGSGGTAVMTAPRRAARVPVTPRLAAKVVGAGLAVGFLTGFLGVGGGFIIVPALIVTLGLSMPAAVGTSLLVIAVNSAAALAARVGHETFDWAVIVPFTVAAIGGSLAGKRVADRVSGRSLSLAFAGLLIAIAIYVSIRSIVALA